MEGRCLHCDGPTPEAESRFCCSGCEAAHALLEAAGLDRYYALRAGPSAAVTPASERDEAWLSSIEEQLSEKGNELTTVELDVQGLHCAACVWVIEQLFERKPGAGEVVVNPGAGKLLLEVRGASFPLRQLVGELARLGYRLGPSSKQADNAAMRALLLRIGVCAALAMNVMIFTFALYAGLDSGPLHTLMLTASWALTGVSVVVGGYPFFKSAIESVRSRALHLDIPIALGIALAFAGSTYSFIAQQGRASYFDTVATFVTLMLVGRYLQERVLEQNRRALLADDGVENLLCNVIEGGRVRQARVAELRPGDSLLLRPGDLVPVDAELRSPAETTVSREWITGESSVRASAAGETLEAGSFHAGRTAATAVAKSDFASSRLAELLRRPRAMTRDRARQQPFWQTIARWYVVVTLSLATVSGLLWTLVGRAPSTAVEVVVAILVVTCPCAFGIAVPVAYELVQAKLRREGVFVRSSSLLDRAPLVREVVFDKTGTLTLGSLELCSPEALDRLSDRDARALFQMAVRSSHPKSRAVAAALSKRGYSLDEACEAEEHAGKGVSMASGEGVYRLGSAGFAAEGEAEGGADLFFSCEGAVLLSLRTREAVRREAGREVAALSAEGYRVHLLSGDVGARVEALASSLGVPAERARAGASPEEKRAYVEAIGASRTLMVGDGVNDAAALSTALCSATPAGDLPFLPARTDVYVQGPLVTGVRHLLESSVLLARVVGEAVTFGVAYNLIAVGAACAGKMSPLAAAILMPLSSLAVVGWVVFRLRARRDAPAACPVPAVPASAQPGVA